LPLSFYEKQLKLKADELISKTIKINEANRALAVANQKLESKTVELDNSNKSLFESNREIAEINKELAETNKAFVLTNKQNIFSIHKYCSSRTKNTVSGYFGLCRNSKKGSCIQRRQGRIYTCNI